MRKNLSLEALEARDCPSSGSIVNGVLTVNVDGPGKHALSVSGVNNGTQIQVVLDGQTSVVDATTVASLILNGSKNGQNVIQNTTSLPSLINGGNLEDNLFGGAGVNFIDGGKGDDVIYSLLGTNTINAFKEGQDSIFTNFGALVNADSKDLVVRFFGPGRTPGTPFIGFDNTLNDGVLYITPANAGSSVVLNPGFGKNTVIAAYDLGDGNGLKSQVFTNVKAVSYFGGAGNDTYINNTSIQDAAYGSAGNDTLVSGYGKKVILKGSSGNDILVGRGKQNDMSGNGGADTLIALDGFRNNIFRTDAADTLFGNVLRDTIISP